MRIPTVTGVIERRILANYRIDPDCMAAALPAPFRPQVIHGFSIGGICLIRLRGVRPKGLPIPWGLGPENAAHRIAVEWDVNGETKHGVYIPRRDTNSLLNSLAGGRLFPGTHHRARFDVHETTNETGDRISITMRSLDGRTRVSVVGSVATTLASTSIFGSLSAASGFFESGSLGYSETGQTGQYDGLELRCENWRVQPLAVESVESSYFDDRDRFPEGSIAFDCGLLMRDIQHEWQGRAALCCSPSGQL